MAPTSRARGTRRSVSRLSCFHRRTQRASRWCATPAGRVWREPQVHSAPQGLPVLRRQGQRGRLQGPGPTAPLPVGARQDRAAPQDRHLRGASALAEHRPQASTAARAAAVHRRAHPRDGCAGPRARHAAVPRLAPAAAGSRRCRDRGRLPRRQPKASAAADNQTAPTDGQAAPAVASAASEAALAESAATEPAPTASEPTASRANGL